MSSRVSCTQTTCYVCSSPLGTFSGNKEDSFPELKPQLKSALLVLFSFLEKASSVSWQLCSVSCIYSWHFSNTVMSLPLSDPQAFTKVKLSFLGSRLSFTIFARNNYHFDTWLNDFISESICVT
jgi:hypothetical protein